MKIENFTILVQGPLHPNSLIALRTYTKDYPVIFSTWSDRNSQEDKIREMISDMDHVSVVSYNIDSYKKDAYDDASRYKQFLTTLRGIKLVETEYVIKVRSDEYYTDFSKLIEKVLLNSAKLITSNTFFRKFSHSLYHPSDHVYGGKTADILRTLDTCVKDCEKLNASEMVAKFKWIGKDTIAPEQQLAINWILRNENVLESAKTNQDHAEIMKLNFDIVPEEEFGFFCLSCHGKFLFSPTTFFEPTTDIKTIADLL